MMHMCIPSIIIYFPPTMHRVLVTLVRALQMASSFACSRLKSDATSCVHWCATVSGSIGGGGG